MVENIQNLLFGFQSLFTFQNLMMTFIGGTLGIIVGAMPGIGAAAGVALLLPMTFKMDPTTAIIMLAGIYYGDMFGGAYSATLLNIPGDSSAVCTSLDGYPLAQKGKAGKALCTSNVSSFIGGTIGILFLTFCGPALAEIGLNFGPADTWRQSTQRTDCNRSWNHVGDDRHGLGNRSDPLCLRKLQPLFRPHIRTSDHRYVRFQPAY